MNNEQFDGYLRAFMLTILGTIAIALCAMIAVQISMLF